MQAFCLLSSGMDSATATWKAAQEVKAAETPGHLTTIFFRYGQRSEQIEEARASVLSERLRQSLEPVGIKATHKMLDLRGILPASASALTNPDKDKDLGVSAQPGFPSSVVEFRNGVFLSIAAAIASAMFPDGEKESDVRIYLGISAVDNSGYPDCRLATASALQAAIASGTVRGAKGFPVRIMAPILFLNKGQTVKLGLELGVPFEKTWSCYREGPDPCLACDSCDLRAKGFAAAGISDPLLAMKG